MLCRAMQLHALWYMSAMTRAVARLNPPMIRQRLIPGREHQLPLDPVENTGKKPGEPRARKQASKVKRALHPLTRHPALVA